MSLEAFHHSEPLTLGVELELQIVSSDDYDAMEDFTRGFFEDLAKRWPGAALSGVRFMHEFDSLQGFLEQVVQAPAVLVGNSLGSLVAVTCAVFFPGWVVAVVAAPLPDPTLLMPLPRRRARWRRRLKRRTVVALCRLLPLELLVPLIARTALLDLGLRGAYASSAAVDGELRRLVARPALRPQAARALRRLGHAQAWSLAGGLALWPDAAERRAGR